MLLDQRPSKSYGPSITGSVQRPLLEKARKTRPDLLLLLSLLLLILIHPVLDNTEVGRVIIGVTMLVSVLLATVRLAELRGRMWPPRLLMLAIFICFLVNDFWPSQTLLGVEWVCLSVFFGYAIVKLFSYLRHARTVNDAHLYTAISIYLLLGILWFAIYSAVDIFYPGSIVESNVSHNSHQTELLYFSLVTLTTIGYGDVVPVQGEVRMLAALEGVTGVLYVAITVALLVGSYKRRGDSG